MRRDGHTSGRWVAVAGVVIMGWAVSLTATWVGLNPPRAEARVMGRDGMVSAAAAVLVEPGPRVAATLRRLRAMRTQDYASNAAQAAAAAPGQTQVIQELTFDSGTFPPPGWRSVDALAEDQGVAPRLRWNRSTCDALSLPGMGWSLGGGQVGATLPCGARSRDPIMTVLEYGPIDLRRYPSGLEVEYSVKLDSPDRPLDERAFFVCGGGWDAGDLTCYTPEDTQIPRWSRMEPTRYTDFTGQSEGLLWIVYEDEKPTEAHAGAFIDDLVLRGIGGAIPSPTGATPTGGVARSPTPLGTPTPRLSPTPLPTDTLYAETFEDTSSGWPVLTAGGASLAYRDGVYRMAITDTGTYSDAFDGDGPAFSEFDASVEVRMETPGNDYETTVGLAIGEVDGGYVVFEALPSRSIFRVIRRFSDGDWAILRDYNLLSASIQQGTRTNLLRVQRRGRMASFWVNGARLATMPIDGLPDGRIGLFAANINDPRGTTALFDNLVVRRLSPSEDLDPAVVYEDRFANPDSGWLASSDAGASTEYVDGEYHMVARGIDAAVSGACSFLDLGATEFDVSVKTRSEGAGGRPEYGLVITAPPPQFRHWYEYNLDPVGGRFALKQVWTDTYASRMLVDWTASPYVPAPGAPAVLRLVARDDRVALFIDSHLVRTVDHAMTSGCVSLTAASRAGTEASAFFDDFVVRRPGPSAIPPPTASPTPRVTAAPRVTPTQMEELPQIHRAYLPALWRLHTDAELPSPEGAVPHAVEARHVAPRSLVVETEVAP